MDEADILHEMHANDVIADLALRNHKVPVTQQGKVFHRLLRTFWDSSVSTIRTSLR